MRITAEQFLERSPTAGDKLSPLYVIHGAEPLTALEAADSLRERARSSGYSEREVFTAESGFDWGRLLAAGNALSLFATLRLLEIRIPTGKPGKEGGAALEAYCTRLPDDTVTLILLPEMDWQMRQAKWFAVLESVAVMIEAMPVDRAHLPRWLAGRLARQQQHADADALDFLADQVEGNLLAAQQEIRKLGLLCPAGPISLALLEESVANVSRFNPFQLTSALYEGKDADKPARIFRMLAGLKAEGEAPPLILWVLTNELRLMMRVRGVTRSGRPPHPAKAREVEKTAQKHSAKSLMALNVRAARIDRMIKGLDNSDPWDALFMLACGLAAIKFPLARVA
ncbi:MAG: DNA polymerase III subunit delta [Betaproteobacteria bacterium]|nr:DNA polymerase III subunit delta [Betaproteobacteria bacterium]